MSRDQSIQASGFYVAGLLCFVLAVLKLTMLVRWSWWRVLLPLWALVCHSALSGGGIPMADRGEASRR